MDGGLRAEYERIGRERDAGGRLSDRERFWFFVRVAAICWAWVMVGGAIMAQAFRINATVAGIYYPDLMDRANLFMQSGLFVGTAGPLLTLLIGWRMASQRGYLS